MSKETDLLAYKKIRKEAVKTSQQLKAFKKDCDLDNPVDMDIIKTTKAMFYEKVITILKNNSRNEEK